MMEAAFGGFIFGALLTGAAFIVFMNKKTSRRKRREIPEWEADFFEPEPPAVTTRIINRHREFKI